MELVPLADLWLPILVSAAIVFIASSIAHMALPWHKSDYGQLPNEDAALEGLRAAAVPPGAYRFPYCATMKEMAEESMTRKLESGPVGVMILSPPGPMRMGGSLLQWFAYSILISFFAGYVATLSLQTGTAYSTVFRVTGTVAILGYATSNVMNSIWKGESWVVTGKFVVDGIVYGLLTGGAFGWLWPAGQ